jgi:transcriptional regulator with XRE-family HTH domain
MERSENRAPIVTSRKLGELIRKRRRELGLSQEQLAELLDVSYQQVQRYERGSNRLSIEKLQQVAAAMAVSLSFFLPNGNFICAESSESLTGEELLLLSHFRRIAEPRDRQLIIDTAKLAARNSGMADLSLPA